MIRWQFHGIGVLTRVWPLHFKDHDDEDYDDVKKLWYTGNVEVLVNSMEIIILLIIWNIVEWGHGIDHNPASDGNHDADHDNAYGSVGKKGGRDCPLFSGLLCYFCANGHKSTFFAFCSKKWHRVTHPVSWRDGQTCFWIVFYTILRQILNYCFCAIFLRELSICAIFYAFPNYASLWWLPWVMGHKIYLGADHIGQEMIKLFSPGDLWCWSL